MIFFGRRKIFLTILVFTLMAAGGWFWRHRESAPFISQPLSITAMPFEYSVSRVAFFGKTGIDMIDQAISKWAELDSLRKENAGLRVEQSRYSEILAENIRLRKLLNFQEGYKQFHLLGSSVISRDYGTWTNTMMIDRGQDSGIKKYMPVIVPEGLVGFVSEVYANTSRVQLLCDPRTTVGGLVQRPSSRVVSMVSGNAEHPGSLAFVNVSREADIIKGDLIITSGYGGVYPKGLIIGTIKQVSDDANRVTLDAEVEPAADFGHLEEVFVITDAIQKTIPEDIHGKMPVKERPMSPNIKQTEAHHG